VVDAVEIRPDDGYHVLSAVGTTPDLVREARKHGPDLIVADIRMPSPTGTATAVVM
jgi:hypothetical protein